MFNKNILSEIISINELSFGYYIGFYQREYKWKSTNICALLDDLFNKFDSCYNKNISKNEDEWDYSEYFLSTIIVSESENKHYLVDGQQRITTVILMLIALYQIYDDASKKYEISRLIKDIQQDSNEQVYIINNPDRREFFEFLMTLNVKIIDDFKKIKKFESKVSKSLISITQINCRDNFLLIYNTLSSKFKNNKLMLDHFFHFLTKRTILNKVNVKNQHDIPLIFEIINDRGEDLNSHEILKGKLLSKINENQDEYVDKWEKNIYDLEISNKVGEFFVDFIFAKTGDLSINKDNYHKEFERIYQNEEKIKLFLNDEFRYYLELHKSVLVKLEMGDSWVSYLNMDSVIIKLIMSICTINDEQKDKKINIILMLFDRFYTILNLHGKWNNSYLINSVVYNSIRKELLGKDLDSYIKVFDLQLSKIIYENQFQINQDILNFSLLHRGIEGYTAGKLFIKYFFSKIELLLENIKEGKFDYIFPLAKMITLLKGKDKQIDFYEIEHIISIAHEDISYFSAIRQRFGAITILKSTENKKSSAAEYRAKINSSIYKDNSLFFNRYLASGYQNDDYNINIKPYEDIDSFISYGIEEREKELTKLIKLSLNQDYQKMLNLINKNLINM